MAEYPFECRQALPRGPFSEVAALATAGEAGSTPASLFASGEEGAWFEPGPTKCFTDTARTTAAGVGDPMGGMTDLSGNGNHATQGTAAQRMTLRQTGGGLYYIEPDQSDDWFEIPQDMASSRWSLAIAYQPTGDNWIAIAESQSTPWAGIAQSGSTSTDLTNPSGGDNAIYFDNVLSSAPNRGDLYTSSQSASRFLMDFTADATAWPAASVGAYAGSFQTLGDIYALVLVNRELTAQERSDLDTYLQTRLP